MDEEEVDKTLDSDLHSEPIEGQIGIEELYVRDEVPEQEESQVIEPIEGQIDFESFTTEYSQNLQNSVLESSSWQDELKLSANFDDEESVRDDSLEDRAELDKFFDVEPIVKTQEQIEKEELDKFFDLEQSDNGNNTEGEILKDYKNDDFEVVTEQVSDNIEKTTEKAEDELNIAKYESDKKGKSKVDEEKKDLEKEVKSLEEHKKRRKSLIESEGAFVNEENASTIKDVDDINKNITDIEVNVGRDVFADYASNSIESQAVEEKEVAPVAERVISENSGEDVVDGMLYKNLDTVLHESMIPYSEHVILDRALPRVEDGLKPVQRRILYSMYELGVTPDKPFRKSARIVGDCLGKYHPHGDRSVYDAMVRMAQPFNTNELLVSGHGNFGSVDGDGAAAMRYTEARLAPLALELLRDLDKNTVKWGLNFDDTLKEPEMLPGRFPNLLVNGTTGIAVGLATNIPPHNLGETIDGVVAYINNPAIKLKEMLKIIKGPDFPTGGYILSNSEIVQAYETGKGKIYMRAKMHIETNGADKRSIVITEMPYQVNKSSLLQKINVFREEGKYGFDAISEVRDESDRSGMRAVIRLKKDADVKTLYESLLKNTELQGTFGINMVAIANGKPKQMGLLDIIGYYAEYQREVILRRSKYDYDQAKEREHILSGLIIAIKNIDAVVKIIKTSKNTTEAKKRLRDKFILSERQAQAILDMRLARLTSLEVNKLEEELKRLRELIKKLTAIINSKKLQFDVVKEELLSIKKQYKSDRKTRVLKSDETLKIESSEPKAPVSQNVVILKSAQNNFKCLNLRQFNLAQKEVNENTTVTDLHTLNFETESTKTLLAFSSLGNCFKIDVKDFPECRYKDKGGAERNIFKELSANETIVALFDFDDTKTKENILFLTKSGMIKKTALSEYGLLKKYFQAMKLKDDDEILTIVKEPESYDVVFVTSQGMILRAENKDIPLQGRISGGVKGINLAAKDFVVGASLCGEKGEILAVTNKGFAKRVALKNIDKMARYRKGLKLFTFSSDNGSSLVYADVVGETYSVLIVDSEGEYRTKSTDLIAIEARVGKGKQMHKLKKSVNVLKVFASRV